MFVTDIWRSRERRSTPPRKRPGFAGSSAGAVARRVGRPSELAETLASPIGKLIYRERAASIECINAQARNRGLYHFPVRGPTKAKVIGLWHALAHNLMRTFRLPLLPTK